MEERKWEELINLIIFSPFAKETYQEFLWEVGFAISLAVMLTNKMIKEEEIEETAIITDTGDLIIDVKVDRLGVIASCFIPSNHWVWKDRN